MRRTDEGAIRRLVQDSSLSPPLADEALHRRLGWVGPAPHLALGGPAGGVEGHRGAELTHEVSRVRPVLCLLLCAQKRSSHGVRTAAVPEIVRVSGREAQTQRKHSTRLCNPAAADESQSKHSRRGSRCAAAPSEICCAAAHRAGVLRVSRKQRWRRTGDAGCSCQAAVFPARLPSPH